MQWEDAEMSSAMRSPTPNDKAPSLTSHRESKHTKYFTSSLQTHHTAKIHSSLSSLFSPLSTSQIPPSLPTYRPPTSRPNQIHDTIRSINNNNNKNNNTTLHTSSSRIISLAACLHCLICIGPNFSDRTDSTPTTFSSSALPSLPTSHCRFNPHPPCNPLFFWANFNPSGCLLPDDNLLIIPTISPRTPTNPQKQRRSTHLPSTSPLQLPTNTTDQSDQ